MNKYFLPFLGITGFLLGLLVSWQFSSDVPIEGNFPTDEITAKEELLSSLLNDQSYLQSRIVSLREEIESVQSEVSSQSELSKLEILDQIKEKAGLTELGGEGLLITLDDSPLADRSEVLLNDSTLVHASDIRDVINALNAGNAESISINNQRVISSTSISSVGATVLVNNSPITPPFEIKAIGDKELMLQRLMDENLLPEVYQNVSKTGIRFNIEPQVYISVPIYNGDLQTDYINLVTE